MRALITGGYGFVGRYLACHLVECGDTVAATYHPSEKDRLNLTKPFGMPRSIQSVALEVTDSEMVDNLISTLQPDVLYHLAAITFLPEAENNTQRVFAVNAHGTFNVMEAIRKHSRHTRLLFVSSAEVYGEPRPGSLPLTELAELRPISAYGVAKAAADLAVFQFAYRERLDAVRARPFPHTGPGQSEMFALSSFAKQIAAIKLKKQEPVIRVGNLEARRDYTDVVDIVRGYREAILNGKRGAAYNFCSGVSHSIGELLARLIELAGIEVEIAEDPQRLRAVDIADLYGSYAAAQRDFGWKPRISLDSTLGSLLNFWEEEIGGS